jgi:hypothetical protein
MLGWEGLRIRLMIRDHAKKKAAENEAEDVLVDGENKVRAEKRMAFRELKAFRQHKPTLESAREDRLKAMAALNLDSIPRYALFHRPRALLA